MSESILRRPEVLSLVGLSNTQVHYLQKRGEFPTSISLGGRAVGWLRSEIDAWIAARVAASRGNSPEQAA